MESGCLERRIAQQKNTPDETNHTIAEVDNLAINIPEQLTQEKY